MKYSKFDHSPEAKAEYLEARRREKAKYEIVLIMEYTVPLSEPGESIEAFIVRTQKDYRHVVDSLPYIVPGTKLMLTLTVWGVNQSTQNAINATIEMLEAKGSIDNADNIAAIYASATGIGTPELEVVIREYNQSWLVPR
jgi:hypothetical protein